jgi:carbon starvation protein A
LGSIFYKPFGNTDSIPANLIATFFAVALWGYFLYTGVTDPLGGINSLWPLFGIANQMLAGVALIMCAVVLIKMKRDRYVWVALVPAVGVLFVTCYAGLQKLFHSDPRVSFLAHAGKYSDALAKNEVLAPAKDIGEMSQIIFNDKINAGSDRIVPLRRRHRCHLRRTYRHESTQSWLADRQRNSGSVPRRQTTGGTR